ncbi:MAG: DeoR family transcriptional regulator [Rhodospirillales bacterium]|jgi:DeoR family transcriptional regulator, glycerol-3-phosphate regulon repressor|nr:DeoR family transcriptional regulator [Rhodospirillales bacterium]
MSTKGRERRDAIFEMVRRRGFVTVEALAVDFAVTSQTIRRDIKTLCNAGHLVRHHGGAGLPSSIVNTDFAARRIAQLNEKEAIANAIADFVPDGASVFMTIGTTMEMAARALLRRKGLRIITNNLHAAVALHSEADFSVSLAGGSIRPHNGGIVGAAAIETIEQYRVDFAIISVGAIEADGTLLDFYADEVSTAQAMVRNARKVLLAVDHTKFDRTAVVRQGDMAEVSALFTDEAPPKSILSILKKNQTELHVCGTK